MSSKTPAGTATGTGIGHGTIAEATKVEHLSSHTYSANFPNDWCIGSVPHGGYITAVFLQVSTLHFRSTLSTQNQPNPITLHLEFLRRTEVGPAVFTVKDAKLGRQTSVIHITLSQGTREEVVGYITHSNTETETGVTSPYVHILHPTPLPVSIPLLKPNTDPNYHFQTMPFPSFRKAATKANVYNPHTQPSGTISDEWIQLSTGEHWTDISLGYACDMFLIPSAFLSASESTSPISSTSPTPNTNPNAKYWFPTLLLSIDFKKSLSTPNTSRRTPHHEYLFIRTERKQIKNGRMDIEATVWDEGGDLVAITNHVALVVGTERNMSARRGVKGEVGGKDNGKDMEKEKGGESKL